jgi:hypothetical protein
MDWKKYLRKLLLSGIYMLGIFGIVATGGGGGGGSGGTNVGFPTPTLPANAIVITHPMGNAKTVAESAILFASATSGGTLKTEEPPTVLEIAKQAADRLITRARELSSVAAGKTEDLSSIFCFNFPAGSAIANYTETANSLSGVITFTNCEFFTDLFVDGNTSIIFNYNDATGDYSQQLGGTLIIDYLGDTATVVSNVSESGNDFSGAFTTTLSFSVTGIPEGPYLVTTSQPLTGNFSSIVDGELIVTGGIDLGPGNTQLRLDVVPGNQVDIYFDAGDGMEMYVDFVFLI